MKREKKKKTLDAVPQRGGWERFIEKCRSMGNPHLEQEQIKKDQLCVEKDPRQEYIKKQGERNEETQEIHRFMDEKDQEYKEKRNAAQKALGITAMAGATLLGGAAIINGGIKEVSGIFVALIFAMPFGWKTLLEPRILIRSMRTPRDVFLALLKFIVSSVLGIPCMIYMAYKAFLWSFEKFYKDSTRCTEKKEQEQEEEKK